MYVQVSAMLVGPFLRRPIELPLPQPAAGRSLSVSEAIIEAGFLPKQDEDVVDMFTQSELLLYRHAQDHRYAYFLGYPMLYHI